MTLDKVMRSRAGIHTAVWNETESWLGPIREYAKVTSAVRFWLAPSEAAAAIENHIESIEKRLQFLKWEATALIQNRRPTTPSALELLNDLFFGELGFQIRPSNPTTDPLLDNILSRRVSPARIGSLLYAWVAELVAEAYGEDSDFVRVDIVSGAPADVVRVVSKNDAAGEVHLLGLADRGQKIHEDRWSQWCAQLGFPRLNWVQGLASSLSDLRTVITLPQAQLIVLDQLIALQPSLTQLFAERAVIHANCGSPAKALDDLKRFFAFNEREKAPAKIVELFESLRKLVTNERPELPT